MQLHPSCREGFRYNLFLVPRAQAYLCNVHPDRDILHMERIFDAFGEYIMCRMHGLSDTLTLEQLYTSGYMEPHIEKEQTGRMMGMAYLEMRGAIDFMDHHSNEAELVVASATLRPIERLPGAQPAYFYVVHAVPLEDFRDNPYRPEAI